MSEEVKGKRRSTEPSYSDGLGILSGELGLFVIDVSLSNCMWLSLQSEVALKDEEGNAERK